MAENRTFKFYGIGYGSTPATITVAIAGSQVFSGAVTTINEPIDPYPYPTPETAYTTELFSIVDSASLNTDFAGNVPMTLTVNSGSGVLISTITSNWQYRVNIDEATGDLIEVPGNAIEYNFCSYGPLTNSESTTDPRSSVFIDSVQQVPPQPVSSGCWVWRVLAGNTISYNWYIGIGSMGNTANYVGPYTPVPNCPPAI